MSNINLYPEMDAQIVGILRISDSPAQQYAASRIEELERQLAEAQAAREEAEIACFLAYMAIDYAKRTLGEHGLLESITPEQARAHMPEEIAVLINDSASIVERGALLHADLADSRRQLAQALAALREAGLMPTEGQP